MRSPHIAVPRRLVIAGITLFLLTSGGLLAQSRENDARRPRLTLRAQPAVAVAPARVVLTAEIIGGADDFEEYYCPAIEWDWGDDTTSESTSDCEPYEAGKSEIKRRFTVEHVFRAGSHQIAFRLKRRD